VRANGPKIVVLAGPTASGKTGLSLKLAEEFCGEIVSADSIQVYRYLDLGSAKPTREERARVTHHMIDVRYPDEKFSAGDYVREARASVDAVLDRGAVPFVVGGTGLYIRLLLGGIVDVPASDASVRERLLEEATRCGEAEMWTRLWQADPETARRTPRANLARVLRGLEVLELTGRPLSEIQRGHRLCDCPYTSLFLVVSPAREVLYERIDKRVDSMIKGGLLEEVARIYSRGYSRELKALQSIGYRHAGMVLSGEMGEREAITLMKRDTRRYAKRQFTWFRSEHGALWCDPQDESRIWLEISHFLGR
jgi:tRNA dimethylallyltransferase